MIAQSRSRSTSLGQHFPQTRPPRFPFNHDSPRRSHLSSNHDSPPLSPLLPHSPLEQYFPFLPHHDPSTDLLKAALTKFPLRPKNHRRHTSDSILPSYNYQPLTHSREHSGTHVFCPESIHDRNMSALSGVKNCVSHVPRPGPSDNLHSQEIGIEFESLVRSQTKGRPLTAHSSLSVFVSPCAHAPHLTSVSPRETLGEAAWQEGTSGDEGKRLTKKQFVSALRAIGDGIMAIVNGVAGILTGMVNAVVELCRVVVRCLTCGKVR